MARRINKLVYRVSARSEHFFVEADGDDDVARWCACHEHTHGDPIQGVVMITPWGDTPRVAVRSNPEYKKAKKELKTEKAELEG